MAFPPADPEVIYDLARSRFDNLLGAVDAIDAKLAAFLGVGSALLALVGAIYALKPDAMKAGGWLVLVAAVVVYAFLAARTAAGMRSRRWELGPEMSEIYDDHITYQPTEIKWRATGTLLRLGAKNDATYSEKAKAAKWCPVLLMILAGLVVAAAVTAPFLG